MHRAKPVPVPYDSPASHLHTLGLAMRKEGTAAPERVFQSMGLMEASWSVKLFTLPSPGGFPPGTGLAGPAPAPDMPAAAATEGVYQSPTVASEEQLRSSWSWNGLNLARQTVCAWPLSSSSAAPLGPALCAKQSRSAIC